MYAISRVFDKGAFTPPQINCPVNNINRVLHFNNAYCTGQWFVCYGIYVVFIVFNPVIFTFDLFLSTKKHYYGKQFLAIYTTFLDFTGVTFTPLVID
jgi:hypothetical protein